MHGADTPEIEALPRAVEHRGNVAPFVNHQVLDVLNHPLLPQRVELRGRSELPDDERRMRCAHGVGPWRTKFSEMHDAIGDLETRNRIARRRCERLSARRIEQHWSGPRLER